MGFTEVRSEIGTTGTYSTYARTLTSHSAGDDVLEVPPWAMTTIYSSTHTLTKFDFIAPIALRLRCVAGGVDGRRSIWGADGLGCKWDLLSVLVLAWSRLSAFLICGCLGLRCAPLLSLPLEVLQAAEPQ